MRSQQAARPSRPATAVVNRDQWSDRPDEPAGLACSVQRLIASPVQERDPLYAI